MIGRVARLSKPGVSRETHQSKRWLCASRLADTCPRVFAWIHERNDLREAIVSVEMLEQVRERVIPMLRLVAEEYRPRVAEGYPMIVDSVASGVVGLEIDPNYAIYITTDGKDLFVDLYVRS